MFWRIPALIDIDFSRHICRQRKKVKLLKRRKCYSGTGRRKEGFQVRFLGLFLRGTLSGLRVAETKVLKQLVRDHIDPSRDLGHSDKHGKKKQVEDTKQELEVKKEQSQASEGVEVKRNPDGSICEDCK
jgi:hypothetical protein